MSKRCGRCGAELRGKFCTSCGRAFDEMVPPSEGTRSKAMSKRARMIYGTAALLLAIVFLVIFTAHLPGGPNPTIAGQPEVAMASSFADVALTPAPIPVRISGGMITFPLSLLLEKKFVQFDYASEGTSVPLLAYISPEGKLVTSVRICEPCNSRTFRIEGTELACGNCETRWKLNNLEGLQGSCQKYPPEPIPSRLNGNVVEIDEHFVKNWKMRI